MPRFRIEYSKEGPVAFISHLDLSKVWERAARRGSLPVALSQGFHPHYRISFGSVLPVGIEGAKEYLDLELLEELSPETVLRTLEGQLPLGLRIIQIKRVEDRAASLMAEIDTAEYSFSVGLAEPLDEKGLEARWQRMRQIENWPVTRKGKKGEQEVDVRPGLIKTELHLEGDRIVGEFWVKMGREGNVRPADVLKAFEKYAQLTLDWNRVKIKRVALYVKRGERWISPMAV